MVEATDMTWFTSEMINPSDQLSKGRWIEMEWDDRPPRGELRSDGEVRYRVLGTAAMDHRDDGIVIVERLEG